MGERQRSRQEAGKSVRATRAAMQGNASLAKGDVNGLMAWLKVIVVIDQLQAPKPAEGEPVQ
jgi:hypothetical protein